MVYKWIQKAHPKKGALSHQLEIPEKAKIPVKLLDKIVSAEIGETIRNPTASGKRKIKVTKKLERRAIFARTVKGL